MKISLAISINKKITKHIKKTQQIKKIKKQITKTNPEGGQVLRVTTI